MVVRQKMKYTEIIGKSFKDIEKHLSHNGIEKDEDDLEEGTPQELYVSSVDGSWQMSLSEDLTIQTIFIYPEKALDLPEGFTNKTTLKDIAFKLGEPTNKGERSVSQFLGPQGAWARYAKSNYTIHFQEKYDLSGLKLITIMTPENTP